MLFYRSSLPLSRSNLELLERDAAPAWQADRQQEARAHRRPTGPDEAGVPEERRNLRPARSRFRGRHHHRVALRERGGNAAVGPLAQAPTWQHRGLADRAGRKASSARSCGTGTASIPTTYSRAPWTTLRLGGAASFRFAYPTAEEHVQGFYLRAIMRSLPSVSRGSRSRSARREGPPVRRLGMGNISVSGLAGSGVPFPRAAEGAMDAGRHTDSVLNGLPRGEVALEVRMGATAPLVS